MQRRVSIPFALLILSAVSFAQTAPAEPQDAASLGAKRVRVGSTNVEASESNDGPRIYPLVNVELTDRRGVTSQLVGFHRVSGENKFVGFLGQAEIEVPYSKIKEVRIALPDEPGSRMTATLRLHSGKVVGGSFDAREGEQLFTGYAAFGRMTIYWRDIRTLTVKGRTKTTDLPKYGPATSGVDVKLKDRGGVETELIAFRRATGDNFISGVLGSARVEVPLRILRRVEFQRPDDSPLVHAQLQLRKQDPIRIKLKSYELERVYRGRAEFGDLRIRLSQVRELTIHRSTPKLRDLDPVAAAEGREVELGRKTRRR